jgi:hypothetical protein
MKRLCLLLSFVIIFGCVKAQPGQLISPQQQREQNIEALKVAFISKELNLSPEEAEHFWPVYNQYSDELKNAFNNPNIIERDENVLNIRKRYNQQFIHLLGPERTNNLFGAEARFRQLLIRTMRRQQRMQENHPNRLLLRRN